MFAQHSVCRFLLCFLLWTICPCTTRSIVDSGESVSLPTDVHLAGDFSPLESQSELECTCREHQSFFFPTSSKDSSSADKVLNISKEARIFYLVGIHNQRTLDDAVFLFRGIRDARNIVLFHIDIKFGLSQYQESVLQREIEACPCGSHVEVASVHNASWSTWSMNLPTLWGMETAVNRFWGKWDVWINLSGDTLPVYTPNRIAKLFGGPLAGINFVTSSACETGLNPTPIYAFPPHWHKRGHYSHRPASLNYIDDDGIMHTNVTLTIHFGSQWMSLQPDWCKYIVDQLSRPTSLASQFRDYLIQTRKLMSDETFFPTLLMRIQPETIPQLFHDNSLAVEEVRMFAIRYERMDEHAPSSKGWFPTEQRYDVAASTGVDSPKPWGPYFLGVYDLENIRRSGALFIRKVAMAIDPNIFRLLPADSPNDIPPIGWPKEVKLSPLPNWSQKISNMKKKVSEGNLHVEGKNVSVLDVGIAISQDDTSDQVKKEGRQKFSRDSTKGVKGGDSNGSQSQVGVWEATSENPAEASDDETGSYLPKQFRPNYDDEVLEKVLASS